MRSVLAVFAGYCVIVAATIVFVFGAMAVGGTKPTVGFQIFILVGGVIAGLIGTYVTTIIGRTNPMGHALALGIVSEVVGVAVTFGGAKEPLDWYGWTLLALPIPVALLGGWLRKMQLAKQPAAMAAAK